jgi:hypothetical protein
MAAMNPLDQIAASRDGRCKNPSPIMIAVHNVVKATMTVEMLMR